jgi:hypothetical protein
LSSNSVALVIRDKVICEDDNGRIRLDDIWELAKAAETRRPKRWRALPTTKRLIVELEKKVRKSDFKENIPYIPVIYANFGRGNGGTFTHPILAVAYAGYLNPTLEIEVLNTWLRYRSGDASLADEILQRASVEDNKWAGMRALSRAQRVSYTNTLKQHAVVGSGYSECTDSIYRALFDGRAVEIRTKRDLPAKSNLRDHFSTDELSYVMASEALAAERIDAEERMGNRDCAKASMKSAGYIREAIERDRQDRRHL